MGCRRAPKGNRNALKQGAHAAETTKEVVSLTRIARETLEGVK